MTRLAAEAVPTRPRRSGRLRKLLIATTIVVATLWTLHAWAVFWGAPVGLAPQPWFWPVGLLAGIATVVVAAVSRVRGWAKAALVALLASVGLGLLIAMFVGEDGFVHCDVPSDVSLTPSQVKMRWDVKPLQSALRCQLSDAADVPRPDVVWHEPLFKIQQGRLLSLVT